MDLSSALTTPPAPPATLVRAFLLRFGAVYSALFLTPIIAGAAYGFEWSGKLVHAAFQAIVGWVARSVLGISYELVWISGSGDTTVDWVWLLCCATIALVASVVWLAIDRRRAHDDKIRAVLRVLIRYSIAFTLLSYGVAKLFIRQFPAPSGVRLLQPYGESSPMGLMWAFMGASPAYVFFSGAAEAVGALLLVFRRTTTLGAFVLAVVLVNVVMMNFCYDVPVKINSSHYLAMCVYLMSPDIAALARFMLLRQPAQPYIEDLVIGRRWLRIARRVLKYAIVGLVIFTKVHRNVIVHNSEAPDAWYNGTWIVTSFQRNGQSVPPVPDPTRWKHVRFQVQGDKRLVRWYFTDGRRADLYKVAVDTKAQSMTFTHEAADGDHKASEPLMPLVLHYVRSDATHLRLDGKIGTDALVIETEYFDPDKTLLMSRGFHWINETSFNR
jgi:uncharacterized membrane protein YphA (DoxX/SURF4 family)